jgi:hypothetical protein
MTIGFPSVRVDDANPLHHLWCNNGTWWVHYTLHYDFRRRRIRRSLGTRQIAEAIRRRDEILARLAREGEPVPERRPAACVSVEHIDPSKPRARAPGHREVGRDRLGWHAGRR